MSTAGERTSTKKFFAGFLLAALLIAGGASYYASSHPDGLEFVADKTGFLDSADDSPTASSPFADYSTKGVDNARVSGGLAGVAGCLIVLGLSGGLFWVLRRHGADSTDDDAQTRTPTTSDL